MQTHSNVPLGAQLARARTDLAAIVRDGPPPREWLPASDGLFLKGKRHLIAAPAKTGKSLAMLSHAVEMALCGGRVAILDRENGADEYARRLGVLLDARGLGGARGDVVTDNVTHYDYPPLTLNAAHDPSYVGHLAGFDLVVLDSSRAFLTMLRLKEDSSDDYAAFIGGLIDPLHREGVATVILDNAGHEAGRPRGSSAKIDLNDAVFCLSCCETFTEDVTGTLRLDRTHVRYGGGAAEWYMSVGGGVYSRFSTERPDQALDLRPAGDLHDAVVRVLTTAERPLGVHRVLEAVRGLGVTVGRNEDARKRLRAWADDPISPVSHARSGYSLGAQLGAQPPASGTPGHGPLRLVDSSS